MKTYTEVLIVEDDEDLSMLIYSILKLAAIPATQCYSVEEVKQILSEHKPKLIISDLLLGGTDGKSLCNYIKGNDTTKDIKVLMMSAFPGVENTCIEAGADDFIAKPFDIEVLTEKVKQLIAA